MQNGPQPLADESESIDPEATFSRRSDIELDVVYCLRNEGMPGLYKIGFTRLSAQARARQLYGGYRNEYTTGVPFPFEVVREWEVPSGRGEEVEKAIHHCLRTRRRNPKREFFDFTTPDEAVAEIENALHELDWYLTAVADAELKQHEAELRAARRKAEREARHREEARARSISARVEQDMRDEAERAFREQGVSNGLKWALIVGLAVSSLGALLDAKDSFGWVVVIAGIAAYYWNRSTPLDNHLASIGFKEGVSAAIAQAMATTPTIVQSSARVPNRPSPSLGKSDNSDRPADRQVADAPLRIASRETSVAETAKKSWVRVQVVAARCRSCGCLHEVNVSHGSFVRVYCERCGSIFETQANYATDTPDELASRVYLVSFKPDSPKRVVPDVTAQPAEATAGIGGELLKGVVHFDAAFAAAGEKQAFAQCSLCGWLQMVDARPGDAVNVACGHCGNHSIATAESLSVGGRNEAMDK